MNELSRHSGQIMSNTNKIKQHNSQLARNISNTSLNGKKQASLKEQIDQIKIKG